MRIIGGEFRGRRISSFPGKTIRPTADRLREAIFNIIGQRVRGGRVLDLFAGTGAMGIEALSRGAQQAVFVDAAAAACSVIRKSLSALGLEERGAVLRWNAARGLNCLGPYAATFELAFLDPPYREGKVLPTLNHLLRCGCMQNGALAVVEHHRLEPIPDPPPGFSRRDLRNYGKTLVSLFEYMV